VDAARKSIGDPTLKCLLVQRSYKKSHSVKKDVDFEWEDLLPSAEETDAVPVPSTHPLFLYFGGFRYKGPLVTYYMETGAYMTALHTQFKKDLKIKLGQTVWCSTDPDLLYGKSYGLYGPLLTGCKTMITEGYLHNPEVYWEILSHKSVNHFFAEASWLEAYTESSKILDLSTVNANVESLETVTVTGKITNLETLKFLTNFAGVDLRSGYFEKEIGMISGLGQIDTKGLPLGSSYPLTPLTGFEPSVRMHNESIAAVNEEGSFCWAKGTSPVMHEKLWTIANVPRPKNKRDHTERVFEKFVLKNLPENYMERDHEGHWVTSRRACMDIDNRFIVKESTCVSDNNKFMMGLRIDLDSIKDFLEADDRVLEGYVFSEHCSEKGNRPVPVLKIKGLNAANLKSISNDLCEKVLEQLGAIMDIENCYLFTEFPLKADGSTDVVFLKKSVVNNSDSKAAGTNPSEKGFLEELYNQVG
jgi:propionyl-CoA synthetase